MASVPTPESLIIHALKHPAPTAPFANIGVEQTRALEQLADIFYTAIHGKIQQDVAKQMGHPQPPTPIQTDNSTANSIANKQCKQQRSKAMDMRFYWLQDRVAQKQFKVFWKPGIQNLADYYSKHHAPIHHQRMRPVYLQTKDSKWLTTQQLGQQHQIVRGCVRIPAPQTRDRPSLSKDRPQFKKLLPVK